MDTRPVDSRAESQIFCLQVQTSDDHSYGGRGLLQTSSLISSSWVPVLGPQYSPCSLIFSNTPSEAYLGSYPPLLAPYLIFSSKAHHYPLTRGVTLGNSYHLFEFYFCHVLMEVLCIEIVVRRQWNHAVKVFGPVSDIYGRYSINSGWICVWPSCVWIQLMIDSPDEGILDWLLVMIRA